MAVDIKCDIFARDDDGLTLIIFANEKAILVLQIGNKLQSALINESAIFLTKPEML